MRKNEFTSGTCWTKTNQRTLKRGSKASYVTTNKLLRRRGLFSAHTPILLCLVVAALIMGCGHATVRPVLPAFPDPANDLSLTPIESEPGYWRIHLTDLDTLVRRCQDAERDRDVYRKLLEQYHIEYGGK